MREKTNHSINTRQDDLFRLTTKTKDYYIMRACQACPYDHDFCEQIETCPAFHQLMHKLGEYEDIMDIGSLAREHNRKSIMSLPLESEYGDCWLYESHLGGGIYAEPEPLDPDILYCEECGDSDHLLGYAATLLDALNLCRDSGYDGEWLFSTLMEIYYPSVKLYFPDLDDILDADLESDTQPVSALDKPMITAAINRLQQLANQKKPDSH